MGQTEISKSKRAVWRGRVSALGRMMQVFVYTGGVLGSKKGLLSMIGIAV